MAEKAGNIALTLAISLKGLVIRMTHEMIMRELYYQMSMHMFRDLLEKSSITETDYAKAEKMMREKYNPTLGTLFFDISLT